MPYTEKQHKLFEAAAHDPAIAAKRDIPQAQAAKLASEGVKDAAPKIRVRFRKPEARQDAEHWITLHPNGKEANGTRALINGAGQIIGGAGGKLNGKFLNPKTKSGDRPGTEEQHAPAIWLGPANPNAPEGEPGKPKTPPAAEPPKVEQPEPPTETAKPEAPKKPESDPETKKLEAKLAQAKEILEKSGKMPDFMRKGMEKEISDLEAKVAERKGINPPEEKAPEQPPSPAPIPVPTPEPTPPVVEEPKPEPVPEPTPEPIPEQPKEEEGPLVKAGREGDELAAKANTFDEVEAAYRKYREGVDTAMRTGGNHSEEAKQLHKKMMAMREKMSLKSLDVSENAKTLEEHESALAMQRKMYDMTRHTSMNNAHAKAHNQHLKAIKKIRGDKEKAIKKAAKAEEKKTGIKSAATSTDEKYAKASVEEIASNLKSKYNLGFVSKPDTKPLIAERAALRSNLENKGPHEEGYAEGWKRHSALSEQIRSMERYAAVKHFNPVDINAKTQSAKNARKTVAHIEATLDDLTSQGYDIRKVLEASNVTIATGTTGKYGGLAWGSTSGEGGRFMCVDSNKYFDDERNASMSAAEESRKARGAPVWNANSGLASIAIHELAHAAGMNASRNSPDRLNKILTQIEPNYTKRQEWIKRNISEYGATNIKETDAELASKVLGGGYIRGTLPKEVEDHVDWLFMKKGN